MTRKIRLDPKRIFLLKRFHPYLLLLTLLLTITCNRVRLSDAREHYVRGEYHEAVTAYRRLYRQTPREIDALRGVIAFEMAENYRLLNRSAHAATAYGNAIRFGYPDSIAFLRLAQMLHREGHYPKAVDTYREYLAYMPGDRDGMIGLRGAEQAMDERGLQDNGSTRYQIERMELFNSSRGDFSPMLTNEDNHLFFTSSREEIPGEERSPVTGTKYHDLYLTVRNSQGVWQKPKRIESTLNTQYDEGTASVTADGELMFYSFMAAGSDHPALPSLSLSRKVDGVWSAGIRFSIHAGDSLSLFAHPAVSASGHLLFFVSDMPGGIGGLDIWLAHLNHKQEVIRIENAGPAINTPGNEMFPMLRNDTTLYFSSDGHPGRGGLDLFRAVKSNATHQWRLHHLPPPLNSPADDFGITFEKGKERGFFSSNREDARGYDHIWSFEQMKPVIRVEGFVVDRQDQLIGGAVIDVVGSNGALKRLVTDRNGTYRFSAEMGVAYLFLAQVEGFLNQQHSLAPVNTGNDTICFVDFEMTPYNKPVVLKHIYYDFDRAILRPESKEELGRLIHLMQEHPEIRVELSAHTDRIGSTRYNESLSLQRARSVIDYLTAAGIDPARLTAVGCGKWKPKVVDTVVAQDHPFLLEGASLTEDYIGELLPSQQAVADQLNRRTEFRVLPHPLITSENK